jgi:hypothetical protein
MCIARAVVFSCCLLAAGVSARADSPAHGSVFVGSSAAGLHFLSKLDYDYDGAGHLSTSAPTWQRGLGYNAYGYNYVVVDGYAILVGAGTSARVQLASGTLVLANPNNAGNMVALAPDRKTAWTGWKDTPLSSIPISPFANGTAHSVGGDDTYATQIAFTPSNGVFYTTGDDKPANLGNVGQINLTTFQTTRVIANTQATGIRYDPFSSSVVFAASGKAHQIDPANPAVIISSRDDSATENYLDLAPDGLGHLLALRLSDSGCHNPASTLVLIDYSATGLIGDPSTRYATASLSVPGCATGIAYDPLLFADGFDP